MTSQAEELMEYRTVILGRHFSIVPNDDGSLYHVTCDYEKIGWARTPEGAASLAVDSAVEQELCMPWEAKELSDIEFSWNADFVDDGEE